MILNIENCRRCKLYKNQRPLLDNKTKADVMWVGLSAKRIKNNPKLANLDVNIPLSANTASGKLIKIIEDELKGVDTYRTNLVKCLPLDEKGKIRYPNSEETDACIGFLLNEIDILKPKVVFLLGEHVSLSVEHYFKVGWRHWNTHEYFDIDGVYYVPIKHPAYVHKYQQKKVDEYIDYVVETTRRLLS